MLTDLTVVSGAFVQELVPFPSLLIFVPGGATLQAQHAGLWHVMVLACAVGIARVLAGLILYKASGRLNTFLYAKRKSWIGVRRTQVTKVRRKLGQNGGWWTVFTLWALPVVPTILISLSAGFVRIPLRTFVTSTYVGAIVNALTFLLIGYYGLQGTTWLLGG